MPTPFPPPPMTRATNWREELAWAAGFFDGEGCTANRNGTNGVILLLAISQTDEATLQRFRSAVLGVGRIDGPYQKKTRYKKIWQWRAEGYYPSQAVAAMLWPFLSAPKRAQYIDKLSATTMFTLHRKWRICCPQGHPYSEENTYRLPSGKGGRSCIACRTDKNKRYRLKQQLKKQMEVTHE